MPRRLAWKSFPLFAALALFVGWQAQMALGGPRPIDGVVLYAAAIVLFVSLYGGRSVLARRSTAQPAEPSTADLSVKPRALRILIALSVIASAVALVLFWMGGRDQWGWALHLLSLGLLIATAIPLPWSGAQSATNPAGTLVHWLRSQTGEWLPLFLILVVALAIRVWHNDTIPPGLYLDEAREGVAARHILFDPSYRPVYIAYIERPAHHAYLVALSFAVFGDSIASLRLVPAVFGVLNVLAAYLLFNRWFGPRTHAGLIAAALWAVTRYDLTFSRIVFDGDSTPFFVMLTLFFLDRGFDRRRNASSVPRGGDRGGEARSRRRNASSVPRGGDRGREARSHRPNASSVPRGGDRSREPRSSRYSDFILAGLTLGIGQGFYLPMRIFAALLVALGVCLAAAKAWHERSFGFLKPWLPGLLLALVALLLATAPIIEFAVQAPGIFFDRNVSASIFYERAEPNLLLALYDSTLKHLGMFNYQGDQNARHNLPGTPMLDPLSGVLYLLGLGLALYRWRDRRNFVMLVLFVGMLQAGILSTDWEAPQALRSIGVLPSVIYFMTLALVALVSSFSRWSAGLWARLIVCPDIQHEDTKVQSHQDFFVSWGLGVLVLKILGWTFSLRRSRDQAARQSFAWAIPFGVVACVLLIIGWSNLDLYFNHQAKDALVWRGMDCERNAPPGAHARAYPPRALRRLAEHPIPGAWDFVDAHLHCDRPPAAISCARASGSAIPRLHLA